MKTRTLEQSPKGKYPSDALFVLFRPFVEAACRPKIEAEMAQPSRRPSKKELKNIKAEIGKEIKDEIREEALDLPPSLRKKFRKLMREFGEEMIDLVDSQPLTANDAAKVVEVGTRHATEMLVDSWLQTYFYFDHAGPRARNISVKIIDDAMLPPMDARCTKSFEWNCALSALGVEGARAVLRQVKATLPPGQVLPAEAVEYLASARGITFIP